MPRFKITNSMVTKCMLTCYNIIVILVLSLCYSLAFIIIYSPYKL